MVFLDGDKSNIKLDNLAVISRAELLIINQKKLIFDDKNLSETGIMVAKLMAKTHERAKDRE